MFTHNTPGKRTMRAPGNESLLSLSIDPTLNLSLTKKQKQGEASHSGSLLRDIVPLSIRHLVTTFERVRGRFFFSFGLSRGSR